MSKNTTKKSKTPSENGTKAPVESGSVKAADERDPSQETANAASDAAPLPEYEARPMPVHLADGTTKDAFDLSVPIDSIDVGPNMRTEFDEQEIENLAMSMRTIGQLARVIITPSISAGRWVLRAGEKRLRAAIINKWTHIDARAIAGENGDDAAIAENFDRSNISHADRCRYVRAQVAKGVAGVDIARKLRLSPQVISTDLAIITKLSPDIFDSWARHPKASKIALRIYSKTYEEQHVMWDAWLAKQDDPKTRATSGEVVPGSVVLPTGGDGPTRRPRKEMEAIYGDLAKLAKSTPDDTQQRAWIDGAVWAMKFMATTETKVPRAVAAAIDEMKKGPKQPGLFS